MDSKSGITTLTTLSTRQVAVIVAVVAVVTYAIAAYRKMRSILKQYSGFPAEFNLIGNSDVSAIFPDIRGFNRGLPRDWKDKYDPHAEINSDIVTLYCALPIPRVTLNITNATLARDIILNRAAFPKPYQYYEKIQIFGPNIVTTEGSDWKRHRKICAPAFSEHNNALVHEQTTKLLLELFGIWENTGQMRSDGAVEIDDVRSITFDLALKVIATAGFGYAVSWSDDQPPPAGHKMTFKSALRRTINDLPWRIVLPRNILRLFGRGRQVIDSFDEVEKYMKEMIQSRLESPDVERADLLTNLCNASIDAGAEKGEDAVIPDEAELIGNIYIFLLAGHETTARALAYALAILAIRQDVQEKVLEEVLSVVGPNKLPTYAHIGKLKYTEAVLYETLRQYPAVTVVAKTADHDIVVNTTKVDGTPQVVPIPANTGLNLSVVGLHYNPSYWLDPYKYDPERFLKPYNKDAFIPFSAGARACLGRRFSEIEAITAIAIMVSQFHIGLKEGVDFAATDSKGRTLIDTMFNIMMIGPAKLPLLLRRRKV